jgi:hypothetical protein
MYSLFILHWQLHIDSGHSESVTAQEKKEEDFFAMQESFPQSNPIGANGSLFVKVLEIN